jgi:hypothetical protein
MLRSKNVDDKGPRRCHLAFMAIAVTIGATYRSRR